MTASRALEVRKGRRTDRRMKICGRFIRRNTLFGTFGTTVGLVGLLPPKVDPKET